MDLSHYTNKKEKKNVNIIVPGHSLIIIEVGLANMAWPRGKEKAIRRPLSHKRATSELGSFVSLLKRQIGEPKMGHRPDG